jgi:fucose permease
VLVVNTLILSGIIFLFSRIDSTTSVYLVILLSFAFGYFASLQYTSMNTLAYADLSDKDTSMGSTIGSTVQQMASSFAVAVASLITGLFITDHLHTSSSAMVSSIHKALITLGIWTLLSTLSFTRLGVRDGANVSGHAGDLKEEKIEG